MATMQSASNLVTDGWKVRGNAVFESGEKIEQDATRVAAMANLTLVAYKASTGKYVPMQDVDPALVPASLACGAIGGSGPDFAALSSSSFKIGFDGEDPIEVVCDFSGLDTETDTAGYFTCGTNGAIIAAGWDALADAEFSIAVNGAATADITGIDFTDVTTFDEVVEIINNALAGRAVCTYDYDSNAFRFISNTTGETSSVVLTAVSGGAGTDITAAGYLNIAGGSATAGTGGEALFESIVDIINAELAGRGSCSFDGDKFIFWSNNTGYGSAVSYLTAGTTGTDISGASYLNGLTGTGVLTAATAEDGTDLPAGFYYGPEITAAALVAADISDARILVGKDVEIDEDAITLENSLDLDDIVASTGRTIRHELQRQGIYIRSSAYFQQAQPLT